MGKQSDFKNQNPKNQSKKCSFCEEKAKYSCVVIRKNNINEYYFCESCSLERKFGKNKVNLLNKKKSKKCPCCGTSKEEIETYGNFTCSYCFDSFPELEKIFPNEFKKNLEEIKEIIKMFENNDE